MIENTPKAFQSLDNGAQSDRRSRCAQCARPTSNCICAHIRPTQNMVELLILQHPQEVKNAKNTLGLLALSLKTTQILIGENFSPEYLHEALYADNRQPILLYPATTEDTAMGLQSSAALSHTGMQQPETLRLVVIDGTWRKSRKILYVNPELQSLPRLSLDTTPASIYTIRKAHHENQLSTLEASCYALQQLEAQHSNYTHLLAAFADFVTQQAAFAPAAHLHSKSTRDPESL